MKNLFSFSFAALVFTACENSAGNNNITRPVTPPAATPVTGQPATFSQPAATQVSNVPPVQQAQPANNKSGELNPKHGMPGHRCDIAEGAPLNSAPANPVIAQPNTVVNQPVNPTQVVSQPVPTQTSGNVRLNPAHGQPGHDCAVEVGKPLKN